MADKIYCDACEELREQDPSLIANGFSDSECTYMQNDQGLTGDNDDCTDLNNLNDCLIGSMPDEAEISDICDWREYMKMFANNIWTVFKGVICAICGLWTNIHNIWNQLTDLQEQADKTECFTNFLINSRNVAASLPESAFVAGTGVSFDRHDTQIVKPTFIVSGTTYTVGGSIRVDLTTSHWGHLGLTNTGNRVEYSSGNYNKINTPDGNYTLCIIKLQKSQFPWLGGLASCVGEFVNAGTAHIFVQAVDGDSSSNTMAGQWGNDSGRVTVPAGQIWIRVALSSLTTWGIEYGDDIADVTFRATGLATLKNTGIQC